MEPPSRRLRLVLTERLKIEGEPVDRERLIRKLRSVTDGPAKPARLLIIDDDESSRYLIRKLLEDTQFALQEASSGPDGVRAAQTNRPDVILLDFLLQDTTAFDVLDELKADPRTRSIPVVIVTSHELDRDTRSRLAARTRAIVQKKDLSIETLAGALASIGGSSR